MGAASDRAKVYSSSGIMKRIRTSFASGDNWLSVIAITGVPFDTAWTCADILYAVANFMHSSNAVMPLRIGHFMQER